MPRCSALQDTVTSYSRVAEGQEGRFTPAPAGCSPGSTESLLPAVGFTPLLWGRACGCPGRVRPGAGRPAWGPASDRVHVWEEVG